MNMARQTVITMTRIVQMYAVYAMPGSDFIIFLICQRSVSVTLPFDTILVKEGLEKKNKTPKRGLLVRNGACIMVKFDLTMCLTYVDGADKG